MNKVKLYTSVVIGIFIISCEFIGETRLDDQTIIVYTPADDMHTSDSVINFWWEEMLEAEEYCLQIVQPSFSNIENLVFDSCLITNKLSIGLDWGTYEWRLKAKNYSSESEFFTYSLIIEKDVR